MARRAVLIGLLLAARIAHGAGACEEGRGETGLLLGIRDGTLTVEAVDPGSGAATGGLRPGDVVLQANDVVPRTCGEYARAVKAARDDRKALLLLVGRPDGEVVVALGRGAWGGSATVVASGEVPSPTPPARRPAVEPEPPPPPLPPDVAVSVDSVLAELGGLVGHTRAGLGGYREAVTTARRGVETLAVRKEASDDTVTALRRVARLHEVAILAWEAMDTIRERNGMARRLPVSEALAAPYFSGSREEAALDEFEFLHETVVAEPSARRMGETSGEWRPAAARRLCWEHAGGALGSAAATLATGP